MKNRGTTCSSSSKKDYKQDPYEDTVRILLFGKGLAHGSRKRAEAKTSKATIARFKKGKVIVSAFGEKRMARGIQGG